jgi:hypothetical protein
VARGPARCVTGDAADNDDGGRQLRDHFALPENYVSVEPYAATRCISEFRDGVVGTASWPASDRVSQTESEAQSAQEPASAVECGEGVA